MANSEDDHCILIFTVTIEGYISGPAAGDHQLAEVVADGSSDIGMVLENLQRTPDQRRGRCRRVRIGSQEEIREPIDIPERVRCVDERGHALTLLARHLDRFRPRRILSGRLRCEVAHDVRVGVGNSRSLEMLQ